MSGRLELIIGCMYSGKTTELIRLIDRYRSINKNMMILNYIQDTRYGDDNKIYTHSKLGVEAIHLDSQMSIFMDPQLKKMYQAIGNIIMILLIYVKMSIIYLFR